MPLDVSEFIDRIAVAVLAGRRKSGKIKDEKMAGSNQYFTRRTLRGNCPGLFRAGERS